MAKSRYDAIDTKKDEEGNRVYKTIIYPRFRQNDFEDVVIRLEEGRRLDRLANEYYDDTDLWWVIAEANNVGRGTLYVEAGQKIRIPMDMSRVFSNLERLNQNR